MISFIVNLWLEAEQRYLGTLKLIQLLDLVRE